MMTEYIVIMAEIVGTIAFAISGAIIAIDNKLDLFGVIVLGSITAIGGGILRDIILGSFPPYIFMNPRYAIISVITSLIVFIIAYIFKDTSIMNKHWCKMTLNLVDSIGLGIFTVVGATIIINKGYDNFFLVLFCSTLTAVGGGVLRDLLAKKIPTIFIKHIYAVAAMVGCIIFYILYKLNVDSNISLFIGAMFVVIIRLLAIHFDWSLPKVNINE